eukprot:153738-Chlamydomonas_euryale.AAC.1
MPPLFTLHAPHFALHTLTPQFTNQEEMILKRMLESAQTAGLAIALQALATFTLTAADYGAHEYTEMVADGINMVNKAAMAWVLFESCAIFDRALHTRGVDDARHLMQVGPEHCGVWGVGCVKGGRLIAFGGCRVRALHLFQRSRDSNTVAVRDAVCNHD